MFHHFSLHHHRLALLLLFMDFLGLLFSFGIVYAFNISPLYQESILGFTATAAVILLGLYLTESYEVHTQVLGLRAPYRAILSNLIALILLSFYSYIYRQYRGEFIHIRLLFSELLIFTSWAATSRAWFAKRVSDEAAQSSWLIMEKQAFYLTTWDSIVKAIKIHSSIPDKTEFDVTMLTKKITPLEDISLHSYSGILICSGEKLERKTIQTLMELRLEGTLIYSLSEFCEGFIYKIPTIYLQDDWFIFSAGFSLLHSHAGNKLKRALDVAISVTLLMLTLPLMVLAAFLIKLDSQGPILYSQTRSGLNRKSFRLYKFRSMFHNSEHGKAQWAQANDPRVTRIGRFLRLTRIDELPQIFNVLAGDMSIIGPRPERPEFDQHLSVEIPYYDTRYLVKPGITGWAQVMYPYGASIEDAYQKLAFDLYYIKNYSLLLDIAILFKTVRVVLMGRGR